MGYRYAPAGYAVAAPAVSRSYATTFHAAPLSTPTPLQLLRSPPMQLLLLPELPPTTRFLLWPRMLLLL
ncbi:unnamed protein product [Ixodes persulcatus]